MLFRMTVAGIFTTFATIFASSPTHAGSAIQHVFELFTSQGCYSCPPAERLLGEIVAQNENILALEFHVDYWDTLVYGAAGQWQDPFSSPAYSQRQRDYSRLSLSGQTGVYTPQIVVDGTHSFVGSRSRETQRAMDQKARWVLHPSARVTDGGKLTIRVDGEFPTAADIWLVIFDKQHVTEVTSGENMGKQLRNTNVVRRLQSVGQWRGTPVVLTTPIEPLTENQDCAIIIQTYNETQNRITGPILGATKCLSP